MDKFRCPTCLTLLEGGERRCPACRTRLTKRSQPIVLADRSRLTARPPLPRERELLARAAALHPLDRVPSGAPAAPFAPDAIERWFAHASGPGRVDGPRAGAPSEPEPEPLEALLVYEAEIVDDDAPPPVDIDLTTEPMSAPAPIPIDRVPTIGGELHDIFEALHRKARAHDGDIDTSGLEGAGRAPVEPRRLRLTSARSGDRKRWSLDFRTRRAGPGSDAS